jgi:chemotaxis protein methyltransferase CheR
MGTGTPSTVKSQYQRFADLVRDEIGVKLTEAKRQMIEGRLRRRILALGQRGLDDYFRYLFDQGGLAQERDEIFDAVTTNKTDFYREPAHYRLLASDCVPAFRPRGKAMFKVWSAASSTGAEAWTAAFVLADLATERPFEWAILGTDINSKVLEQARLAIYPSDEVHPVSGPVRDRYLMQGRGKRANDWRVAPHIRRRVSFQRLNLMDQSYPVGCDVDVIFLRNVLIYFQPADQAAVIERLARHLIPGGHFFVGHSESMIVQCPTLRQIAPASFIKV